MKKKTTTKECNRHTVHSEQLILHSVIAANIYISFYFTVEATVTKKNSKNSKMARCIFAAK